MSSRDLTIRPADPRSEEALGALRAYVGELSERSVWAGNPDAVEDVDDFVPPSGGFLLATSDGGVVACGGVRTLGPGVGELKRMWVRADRRRQGIGTTMLRALEQLSLALGHDRLRLDTAEELTEAIAFYEREGFGSIDRYNDAVNVTRFFEKVLTR